MPETTSFTPSNILAYARETPPDSIPGTVKSGQVFPAGQVVATETSSGKLVAFNKDGSGGAEIAIGVVPYAVDASATGFNRDVEAVPVWTGNAPLLTNKLVGMNAEALVFLKGRVLAGRNLTILP